MEFESFYECILLFVGIGEGESAKVDSLLAIIGPEGTDVSGIVDAHNNGTLSSGDSDVKEETPAQEKTVAPDNTSTTNETEGTTNTTGGRIFASPLAKKIAKDKGINLADLKGSG